MIEYRVKWQQCPTNHHDPKVVFVKAATPVDAKALVKNHVERRYGIDWFVIGEPEVFGPVPDGEVQEGYQPKDDKEKS